MQELCWNKKMLLKTLLKDLNISGKIYHIYEF